MSFCRIVAYVFTELTILAIILRLLMQFYSSWYQILALNFVIAQPLLILTIIKFSRSGNFIDRSVDTIMMLVNLWVFLLHNIFGIVLLILSWGQLSWLVITLSLIWILIGALVTAILIWAAVVFLIAAIVFRNIRAGWNNRQGDEVVVGGDFGQLMDEDQDGQPEGRLSNLFEKINTVIFKQYMNLKEKLCPIWLEDYKEDDILKVIPGWNHTYHDSCFQTWFERNQKWPLWNNKITPKLIKEAQTIKQETLELKIQKSLSLPKPK